MIYRCLDLSSVEAQSSVALPVALALELSSGERPSRLTLGRDEAAELAALVAADLQALLPRLVEGRLALAGALFDAAELLRPGFPVWTTLDELARRVPRGHLENVVAFGAHEGRMPAQTLEPDPAHAQGPMRLLPLSLLAPSPLAGELAERMEVELVGRGEAGQRTADWLMRMLGVQLEHVRYLSRNDLLALTCVQYEHANLASLWTLLEAALLTPYREERALSARGLALRYADGAVHVQPLSQWLQAQPVDPAQRRHGFAGALFELRQYALLLGAHAVALRLDGSSSSDAQVPGALLESVAQEGIHQTTPATLYAHEAPGLGVVAVTVAAMGEGHRAQVLAHGYPLVPHALRPLLAHLSARFGTAPELHALGGVLLDDAGRLGVPASTLH